VTKEKKKRRLTQGGIEIWGEGRKRKILKKQGQAKGISLSLWNVLPALQTEVTVVGAGQVVA